VPRNNVRVFLWGVSSLRYRVRNHRARIRLVILHHRDKRRKRNLITFRAVNATGAIGFSSGLAEGRRLVAASSMTGSTTCRCANSGSSVEAKMRVLRVRSSTDSITVKSSRSVHRTGLSMPGDIPVEDNNFLQSCLLTVPCTDVGAHWLDERARCVHVSGHVKCRGCVLITIKNNRREICKPV